MALDQGTPPAARARRESTTSSHRLQLGLVALAVLFFLGSRLVELERHPSYFFCDEAIHGVEASALLGTGRDRSGERAPVYFRGLGNYALSLSVWLAIPFVALFGKTIFAVRLVNVATTLLTVLLLIPIGRAFGIRQDWLVLALSLPIACFFLVGRSGFEYASFLFSASLAIFLYIRAYVGDPRSLIASGAAFGLCSYSYLPARAVAPATMLILLGLFVVRKRPARWIVASSLASFLAALVPSLVFTYRWPEKAFHRFSGQSFVGTSTEWVQNMVENFLLSFSFQRLFGAPPLAANPRHFIEGQGNFPLWFLPLLLCGLFALAAAVLHPPRLRSSDTRTDNAGALPPLDRLLVLAAIAIGSTATVMLARTAPITRGFTIFIPILILSAIGLEFAMGIASRRLGIRSAWVIPILVFALLSTHNAYFLWHYLDSDGLHTKQYGLYGLQYGAPQAFEQINLALERDEDRRSHVLTDLLFDAPHVFVSFFVRPEDREHVKIGGYRKFARANPQLVRDARYYVADLRISALGRDHPHWCHLGTVDNPDGSPQIHMVDPPVKDHPCPVGTETMERYVASRTRPPRGEATLTP